MNPREKGFLLLTSHLGVPDRKVLSQAQLRQLSRRTSGLIASDKDRDLELQDLIRLGYGPDMAVRILGLLNDEEILLHYLHRGRQSGCTPLTRVSATYPQILRGRLGPDAPGCLWIKGDRSVLDMPGISLVGSRELLPENRAFAEAVGIRAAERGLALISGNARGADRTAQEACLRHGGYVISIVADRLDRQETRERVLPFYSLGMFFIVRLIRLRFSSTSKTLTFTTSPTFTTSLGWRTLRLQTCEICTRPS